MTKTLLTGGLMAGAIAGLVAMLLQLALIQPLIVEAERYESDESVLPGLADTEMPSHAAEDAPAAHTHDHGDEEASILVRGGLTLVTMVLTWGAFGLLASAGLMTFRALSAQPSPGGAVLGLAGFAVFSLAPALGLPPELPGMSAAELEARQFWWVLTAGATAIGLFLAAGMRNGLARLAGLALIVLPHVIGAPHPVEAVPAVPPELASLYAARVLGMNLVGWLVLGTALLRFLPDTAGGAAVARRPLSGAV